MAMGSQDKADPTAWACALVHSERENSRVAREGEAGAAQTDLERVPSVRKQLCKGADRPGDTHRRRALRALPCGSEQLGLGLGKAPVEASREVDSQSCRDCLRQPRRG